MIVEDPWTEKDQLDTNVWNENKCDEIYSALREPNLN